MLEGWDGRAGGDGTDQMEGQGQGRYRGGLRSAHTVNTRSVDSSLIPIPALTPARLAGLVLLPSLLPPALQRSLAQEALRHSVLPNLTSLSAHYTLPTSGLWPAWEAGRGAELVQPVEAQPRGAPRRARVDLEPITRVNWQDVNDRGVKLLEEQWKEVEEKDKGSAAGVQPATVAELLPRLRWTTIGWSYNVSDVNLPCYADRADPCCTLTVD